MKGKLIIVVVVVVSVVVAVSMAAMAQETKKETAPQEKKAEEVKKIDINSATPEELETLPGIGPKLAQVIIDGRPYEKIEDVMNVKGIGEKKFAQIKNRIEVKPVKTEEKKEEKKSAEEPKKEETQEKQPKE